MFAKYFAMFYHVFISLQPTVLVDRQSYNLWTYTRPTYARDFQYFVRIYKSEQRSDHG